MAPRSTTEHRTRPRGRAQLAEGLGWLTVAAGVVWAIVQPDRLTLLHPFHQGFWWLVIEPPLLVMLVGAIFVFTVARPLVADQEERDGAAS